MLVNAMERDWKQIWENFNHEGQPLYGMAKLALENGDIERAMQLFTRFEKVWDEVTK